MHLEMGSTIGLFEGTDKADFLQFSRVLAITGTTEIGQFL